jgi:hypothetical protein
MEEVMQPDLQSLIELQSLDKKIIDLQDKISNIPLKVKTVEQPLVDAQSGYESQKKRYEEFLKKKKDREVQLDEINDKINKQKEKSSQIKTNKEYQAHLKSIESLESEMLKKEDELLVLMEELDGKEKELKDVEGIIKQEEVKIEQFKETLEKEAEEAEAELGKLRSQRSVIADKISRDVYDAYMKQLEQGQGIAVVEVRDEICQGCNMNIPPQLYVEVRKGEAIHHCPQCRRFLFFSPSQGGS